MADGQYLAFKNKTLGLHLPKRVNYYSEILHNVQRQNVPIIIVILTPA